MKEVGKKLLAARKGIAETPIKKEGKNTYSNYNYFTPTQVSELVSKACQDNGLLTIYSLENSQFGYHGKLTVTDIESGESIDFSMATALPEITATNAAQKLGGMATFNERYLKMSVFEILDNNLDFDAQDNREKQPKPTQAPPTELPELTEAQFKAMLTAVSKGQGDMVKAKLPKYKIDEARLTQLKGVLKLANGE